MVLSHFWHHCYDGLNDRRMVQMCIRDRCPTKYSPYTLLQTNQVTGLPQYLKHSPSFGNDLKNCFIRFNYIWSGGSKSFCGSIKLFLSIFLIPGSHIFLIGHSFFLEHPFLPHRKHGNLVYPLCCPSITDITTYLSRHKLSIYDVHRKV